MNTNFVPIMQDVLNDICQTNRPIKEVNDLKLLIRQLASKEMIQFTRVRNEVYLIL